MGRHLSELQTSSTKHQSEAGEEELEGGRFPSTHSAPLPLGHQSLCFLCFRGATARDGARSGSPWGSPPEGQETLRKSEPEPRQQWAWHQPPNLCPDSQELNQVSGLRNTMNNMPHSAELMLQRAGRRGRSIFCFTFRA